MARYKNCCLCTDVKTGAIILATIGLVLGGFTIILESVILGVTGNQDIVKSIIKYRVSNHVFLARMQENSEC